ncbi:MAG: helicase [Moraxellaceae bacterium]|nr:helicase [Moraxellaceae bacterium]
MSFSSLKLHESVQQALAAAGYTEPTPVQAEAIPAALEGRDLIVSAQTGTGKTAAFMLPALSAIADDPRKAGRGPRILVLTPTRELAQQVTAAAQKYSTGQNQVRTVSVLGGMPFPAQNRLLARPYDIMVATPGRLLDHMSRGRIVFERLDMLVLDEADRMLDMGFIDDVERIAAACPAERQTLLFSATFEDRINKLAGTLMKDPLRIDIAGHKTKHEQIEQRAFYADDLDHKKKLLMNLLTGVDVNQAIVFTSTRIDSDALADELAGFGFPVDSLHGDMKQSSRNRTLTALRSGRTKILVATDVAARGIDVPGISHVINYDLPKNAEDYVHRIGRTGRAGRTGIACSLVGPRDRSVLRRIEQFLEQKLEVQTIEGLEPQRRFDADRPRRPAGAGDKPRWGNKDRVQRDDRQKRFADRPARPEGASDRPARSEGFVDRAARPARTEGYGDRPARTEGYGDRPARTEGFAQRRAPEGRKFSNGPRPEFGNGNVQRRDDNIGNRAAPNYDERQPRLDGDIGELQRRDFMARTGLAKPGFGGPRKPRPAGGHAGHGGGERRPFVQRSAQDGGFNDRPRRDVSDRPAPAVQVQTKTRRRFGEDVRDDAGNR